MRQLASILLALSIAMLPLALVAKDADKSQEIKTVKKERVHLRKGNKLYKEKRYAEAEVEFRKATQANPGSPIAAFNLATALLKQDNGAAKSDDPKSPANEAKTQLENIIKTCPNRELTSKAFYNLGNIAFNREDWDQAIENYKNALRRNPADDEARDNLRLAQLKKQQSQNDKNQNKDQNKDQQNQDKDKNKDKQDQKDQQQQQNQNQNQDQQQKQQQQQQGMSQQNVEQVLKTMQDKEQETQRKVNASQAEKKKAERRRTQNQW